MTGAFQIRQYAFEVRSHITLLSRAGKKGGTQQGKFKLCPNRKLYNNCHTKLTMGSLKEKPRRGKQGKKFKEEETWEQLAEISKEYIIIELEKRGAHSR